MTISITQLYDLLLNKLGKETAQVLTGYIEDKIKAEFEMNMLTLATKQDIGDLRSELNELRGELRLEIANTRTELIRWMFIFWVGQAVTTFAFILLFIKK